MPGTPFTLPYWGSHVVGTQGTLIVSGCPSTPVDWSFINGTWTMSLEETYTGMYGNSAFYKSSLISGTYTIWIQFQYDSMTGSTIGFWVDPGSGPHAEVYPADETAILADLRSGCTANGSGDWTGVTFDWQGCGVGAEGEGEEEDPPPGYGGGLYAYNAYFRFQNLSIPKNVVINNAFIRFTAQHGAGLYGGGNENDVVKIMLLGQAADTGTVPADAFEAYALEKTESCQNWDDIEPWEDDEEYDSPDISCVIQEIVDRSGWESGNDITIFAMDYDSGSVGSTGSNQSRFLYDYDDDSEKAAQLFIYFSLEENGTGGVVCGGTAPNSITSINTYNEVASGGIICGSTAIVLKIYINISIGGITCAGIVGFTDGGGGPSVPNCSARGSGTPVGRLIEAQIIATEDDGTWNFSYAITNGKSMFGSIAPEV